MSKVKAMTKWLISGGLLGALLMAIFGEILAQPIVDGWLGEAIKTKYAQVTMTNEEKREKECFSRLSRASLFKVNRDFPLSLVHAIDIDCNDLEYYRFMRNSIFPYNEYPERYIGGNTVDKTENRRKAVVESMRKINENRAADEQLKQKRIAELDRIRAERAAAERAKKFN